MTLQKTFIAPAIIGAAALIAVVGFSTFARAADAPTITAVVQNGSNANITSALVGTGVHASVTVASTTASTSPAGLVDFNLYSGNQSCSGSPVAQTGIALVDGSAISATTTVPVGGLSYKVHYNGFNDIYAAGDSICVPVSATQFSPTISLGLSNSSVVAGSSVYASSTLVNESSTAGGTVAYKAYSNNACTLDVRDAGTMSVTNGNVPNSNSLLFNNAGTFYFQAVYSGDSSNGLATSSCTTLTVTATSTPPVTGAGTISGNVFNDQNGNDVKDGSEPGLSGWTVWLHKAPAASSTPWWKGWMKQAAGYDDPIVATALTDGNGNYSFGSLSDGKYFIEEQEQSGWNQTSSDSKVTLDSTHTSGTVNFANMQKATTTPNGGHHDGDNDNDDDDNATSTGHGDNGNHNGWFKFNGNFMGWLHFGKK